MTTIYELEKQATPGPLEIRKGKAAHVCLYVTGTAYNVAVGMKEKDAKIFTHCRNHFMEALRALIAEHDWRMSLRYETKGEKHIPETCPTCRLIKALERKDT